MSGTMTKIEPSLQGIPESINVTYIEDIKAPVFNFSGD